MTSVDDYKMIYNSLARLRIVTARMPDVSGKRGRALEIVNTIEDMCVDNVKRNLELVDLAEELRQILSESIND